MRRSALVVALAATLAVGSLPAWAAPPPAADSGAKGKSSPAPSSSPTRPDASYGLAGEPGSGVRLEPRAPRRGVDALAPPLPLRPETEDDSAALEQLEAMFHGYREAADEVEDTVQTLVLIEGEEGRVAVERSFEERVKARQGELRALRSKAVARYETFLAANPNDPLWTPEVLFRLGELEFVTAEERHRRQEEAWQAEVRAIEEDPAHKPEDPLPPAPLADYRAAIGNFRQVVERFPNYPHADESLYMLAILLSEQEDEDGSRRAMLALVCANHFSPPPADFVADPARDKFKKGDYDACTPWSADAGHQTETWLRLGEAHYDVDEYDAALVAYENAAKEKGDLYDEALVRIAWTLYLQRRFAESVERLDEFVRWADSVAGTPEGKGAADLRKEAIRYIAKAYIEEDWDGDGRDDKLIGLARLDRDYGQRTDRHVAEVYAALGDIRARETQFKRAINIWETTLGRFPLSPAAPSIRFRIMQAWLALQELGEAGKSRDRLATDYLRGTKWFYANESDVDAIAAALELAEDALVATAIDHHEIAQKLRSEGDPRATEEYAIAARAYAAFLERFPDAPNSYKYRYEYAESLYYSGQFLMAATEYAAVRDSDLDNRLQRDAAEGVMFAWEGAMAAETKAGTLTLPDIPRDGSPGPFAPVEPPPLVRELQRAYDAYVALFPGEDNTGRIRFDAATLSQRYNRFDESEPRYIAILDRHCDEDIAINAGYSIIDIHVVQGDLQGTREWTDKLVGLNCGSESQRAAAAGKLRSIGNAVRFQEATLLLDAGEFEAAADRYVALVDEAPDDPNADRALNNAAVAYEQIGRFGSASKTYERIYSKYPDSEFADDALLRAGFNHAKFFEFQEAVDKYVKLAQDPRYAASEHRGKSLKNAASLMESLQDYKGASAMYSKWAQQSADPGERAEGAFLSAGAIAKTGSSDATIKGYKAFVTAHGSDPAQTGRTLEAWLKIGKAYAASGRRRDAEAAYRSCVNLAAQRAVAPASEEAEFPAQAQFFLAEMGMEQVLAFQAQGTGKKLKEQFKRLFQQLIQISSDYEAVFPYRRLEWTLAAMYRRGYGFETVATKVRNAPVPKQLKEYSEAWFFYKDLIAEEMQGFEDKAVSLYEETVKRSVEFKISTEYTRRARERLNLYKPDEYPLLRDPALELQLEVRP